VNGGFTNQVMSDSWRVGLGSADHVDADDGSGLGVGARRLQGGVLAARRQGPRRPSLPGSAALLHGSQHHLAGSAGPVREVELGLEAVLALEPGWRVRGVLRNAGHDQRVCPPRADVRFHHRARPRLGGWCQRGQAGQALGRSRGGFSTKIHLKTDLDGDALAFDLTGGEASDSRHFPILLDLGPEITPRAAVGDKGYDANANREAARSRGICPAIPSKTTAKHPPAFFPKALYRGRARIEQTVGKLKRFKRIALRCEKTARNFGSFVALALGFILVKSVHTA
jgi:transposase